MPKNFIKYCTEAKLINKCILYFTFQYKINITLYNIILGNSTVFIIIKKTNRLQVSILSPFYNGALANNLLKGKPLYKCMYTILPISNNFLKFPHLDLNTNDITNK